MGILLSLSAAFFFALSQLSIRQGVQKLGVSAGIVIMLAAGTVITLLVALLVEGIQPLQAAGAEGLLYFAAAGVIHFLGGWGFMNASASRIGATRVNAMTTLTPLFATMLAFLTLKQAVNSTILFGIFLITIGIFAITSSEQ
ncbi:MAG: DMT family transporter [Anaerolineales bacterium]|nr:DMT family transporter [Anaerolineales bacterium]